MCTLCCPPACSLKASYQFRGEVFMLQETWKLDKQNKVVGT